MGVGRRQAIQFHDHVGRHRDELGSQRLPLASPGRHHLGVPQTSNGRSNAPIPNAFDGKIIGLGIAPDGVRVAAIAQTGAGRLLELAAIDRGAQPPGQRENPTTRTSTGPSSIGQPVRLGPNITDPIALTWYDADNLLVLDGTGNGSTLWEVPVDGQPATELPGVLPGAVSITADGP